MTIALRSLGAALLGAALLAAGCATPRTIATTGAPGAPAIAYRVSVPDPADETFVVTGALNNIPEDTIIYHFPIWAPGAYDIVNFGAYVNSFTATGDDGRELAVLRSDTNTFRIVAAGKHGVTVHYRVHDIESTPNSLWFGLSDIEPTYAFATGTALFGYPEGHKDVPTTVDYEVPSSWDIAIGLDPTGEPHTYRARDYDELVDAPLQMGKFQRYTFSVNGKPHVLTLTAPEHVDSARAGALVRNTDSVVRIVSGFFGDMPYDRYVFQLYLVTPAAGDMLFGALEHRNSSTYRMPYMRLGDLTDQLQSVIAHEYWHVWSPKRIHVAQLGPFDYQSAPRTKSLWFAEGITEYYARVLLLRNHMTGRNELLSDIEQAMSAGGPRPQKRSITDVSWDISYSDPMENLALYSKGPIVALFLDAEIRLQTGNKKSLDDVMRFFNERYGKTGRTFTDDQIIPIMEEATGARLGDFYRRWIDGHDPLPYTYYLPKIGVSIDSVTEQRAELGAELKDDSAGWAVAAVTPGASADSTGLIVGDVITGIKVGPTSLKIADLKVPAQVVGSFVDQFPAGTELQVLRDGRTMSLRLSLQRHPVGVARLGIDTAAAPEALAIRRAIFGS